MTASPSTSGAEEQTGTERRALLLAATSGYVDGVGASTITGLFVSFMSGNTTSAGVALGTAHWTVLARVGMTIPLYVAAVTTGALVFTRWPRARPALYGAVAVLLTAFVVAAHLLPAVPATGSPPQGVLLLALLVLPMGLLNTTLRKVGPNTVGLGYVTGTLVSLGESIAALLTRRQRSDWGPVGLFSGLWLCFFLGAALGAGAAARTGSWAAIVPTGVLIVLLALDLRRRPGSRPPAVDATEPHGTRWSIMPTR